MKFLKWLLVLFCLGATISNFAQYGTGVGFDKTTGLVNPSWYYYVFGAGTRYADASGTTPSLSWNYNVHKITLSGNTVYSFANAPSLANTIRPMHVVVIGDGTYTFTTAASITWVTPTSTPISGYNEYIFEYHAGGTIYGWQLSRIECFEFDISGDETTALTTGTAKYTWRTPCAFYVTSVRASLTTTSSSGNPAIDINEGGSSIFTTTLTIDSSETTSTTAATAAVIGGAGPQLADDASITFDIDTAGTGAAGLKIKIYGYRN